MTGEVVSAQTVSKLSRDLDEAVRQFHEATVKDEWAYLFLDGVNLKVRRERGRKCVQMLVAYGVRADGTRQLLSFMRSQGESQLAWEGLLNNLYQRGLKGRQLQLIVTDGCPGLRRPFRPFIREFCINATGYTRCVTSGSTPASGIAKS